MNTTRHRLPIRQTGQENMPPPARRMPTTLAILFATCAAIHPVFRWAVLRTWDGSDEPYGVVALLAIVALVLVRRGAASSPRSEISLTGPALCLGLYAVTYPFLTPLPRSMIAMTALALLLSRLYFGSNLNLGLLGLLQLALPMIASIQFYLGYPLRLLVAEATAGLLRCGGFDVSVVGVGLELGERSILVDAPCSGIKMLWAGAFVTCLFAAHFRLRVRETMLYMTSAALSILTANILRAAALFYVELRLLVFPAFAHGLIGLVMFGLALAAIAVVGRSIMGASRHA